LLPELSEACNNLQDYKESQRTGFSKFTVVFHSILATNSSNIDETGNKPVRKIKWFRLFGHSSRKIAVFGEIKERRNEGSSAREMKGVASVRV
jgi:hypothetical protein